MIALVTAAVSCELDEDLPLLGAALERAGTQFHIRNWHDDVDWSRYDAIFLRSPWDYHLRRDEFLAWIRAASWVTRVVNPFEIVEWNSNKRYLDELIAAGIAVVPTRFIVGDTEVDDVLGELGSLVEHRIGELEGIFGVWRASLQRGFADQLVQHETQVFEWGAVHSRVILP